MQIEEIKGNWVVVSFTKQGKTHVSPKDMVIDIVRDLEDRGCEPGFEVKEAELCHIDAPQIVLVSPTFQQIKIDSLEIIFPTLQFQMFLEHLEGLPERTFKSGKKFYKLHGFFACVVLTPEQRDLLVRSMREMLPAVEKLAAAEWKSTQEKAEELRTKIVEMYADRGDILEKVDDMFGVRPKKPDGGGFLN